MAEINSKFYEGIAEEFIGKLHRLNNFTTHALSIGNYHEEILKSSLRSFLPQRFSLRTGFVFAGKGKVSNQIDILIVDESEPTSYFFKEGDFVVVHPDAVVCGIEVKTKLDKNEFKKAVKNIQSLRMMSAFSSVKKSCGGMIFSFSGAKLSAKLTHGWWKDIDIPEDMALYPTTILVLDQGRIDLRPQRDNSPWGHYFVMGEEKDRLKTKSLSVFFGAIKKMLELKSGKTDGNPFAYADFEGQMWTLQYLRFGKGLISA